MKWIKIINPEIHKEELDELIHFLDKNNFNYEIDEKTHSQSVNQREGVEGICLCNKALGFTLVAGYSYCNQCGKRY